MASDIYAATTPVPKPVISHIAAEWDAEVGQPLAIPLSVTVPGQGAFQIVAKPLPNGAAYSTEYTSTSTHLPTIDFDWTPVAAEANKVYKVTFTAQETAGSKLKSAPIKTTIRVWPAGESVDQRSVQKLVVSSVNWASNELTLKGKVVLSNLLTPAEKTTFLARQDLKVNIFQGTTGTGTEIVAAEPIKFDSKGNFSLSGIALTGTTFNCSLTVDFELVKAARKIGGAPKTCAK
jgi:hypothetical protein